MYKLWEVTGQQSNSGGLEGYLNTCSRKKKNGLGTLDKNSRTREVQALPGQGIDVCCSERKFTR